MAEDILLKWTFSLLVDRIILSIVVISYLWTGYDGSGIIVIRIDMVSVATGQYPPPPPPTKKKHIFYSVHGKVHTVKIGALSPLNFLCVTTTF